MNAVELMDQCHLVRNALLIIRKTFAVALRKSQEVEVDREAAQKMQLWASKGIETIEEIIAALRLGVEDLAPYETFVLGLEEDILELQKQMGDYADLVRLVSEE